MPTLNDLTPEQAHDLAETFHDLANAVAEYRIANAVTLTHEQQFRLGNLQSQFLNFMNTFIVAGLQNAQNQLAPVLASLGTQTKKALKALSKIQNFDKALEIATAAAVLGASIFSMDPAAIKTGIQGLIDAITPPLKADTGN